MKRFVLLSALLALSVFVLAAAAQACVVPPGDSGGLAEKAGTSSGPSSSTAGMTSGTNEAERTGTVTTDGTSITVTASDGSSITCAVPTGLDVTPFLSGQVKAHCESVDGVLTVKELEGTNGAKVEVKDDGTVEVNGEDAGENEADDDADDDGGAGAVNSGTGSADDDNGPSGADQSGSGGGDDGNGGDHGDGGGDGGHDGGGGGGDD